MIQSPLLQFQVFCDFVEPVDDQMAYLRVGSRQPKLLGLILRFIVALAVQRSEDVRTQNLAHLANSGLISDNVTASLWKVSTAYVAIDQMIVTDSAVDQH